ncbi:tRNA-synt_2b domain-containing protein/Seryl_tRNA_N domain-containing protein [Cephalotus follicularis]|uniref:serine--tRNA ligase n=1 Tax=Cephalotus follicularis TaxID=3775 RepID=A0A1Q3CSQ1_CEPFO|nr:tRNA-synt_2b domain-containing protein/Seryl_tRNA_N domain-containing protein [Cephalotus follicularis]
MGLQSCLGGSTLQTLKHAAIPTSVSSSRFIFKPISKTLTLNSLSHSRRHSPFTLLFARALSAPAVQASPATEFKDNNDNNNSTVLKTQWKAAIDFKWIRDNKEAVAVNIKNRNSNANLELVLQLYDKMSHLQKEVEQLRGERNVVANKMKGKLEQSERMRLIEEGKNLKEALMTLEDDLVKLKDELHQEAQCIPNMTHPDVPIGGEDCSTVRKMVGSPREFGFLAKDHVQVGKELDLLDFDAAAEVSGSKFYYLKNEAVMLEMGLINWTLSEVMKRGFTPLTTPEIVRSSVVEKCGFQPRAENTQVYSIEGSDQCLIGTAEIPVGGIHMDSIIAESLLPLKYVAFSHCFRTEAGAAGTASRGLYRVHQFSKLEMFILCRPEESDSHHEELIKIEEDLFSSLGLHYKTLDMASEDLGAPAYRKFDVEAWMPGLGRYGEISSASNCTDYQSRRLGIRFRPSEPPTTNPKKSKGSLAPARFVHTLNATACAIPRMIVCLLENYQQEDGSVIIPEPLRPFMGGLELIAPKSG